MSYFTHSPEFFELNAGVRADLGVNSRDAHGAALVLAGFEFAVPMMDAEVLWQFQVYHPRCGDFVHRLMLWLHNRARCGAQHDS